MPVNLFDTRTLIATLEQMYPPKIFFLDTFFKEIVTFTTKYVDIDIDKGKRKLAAFVRPTSQGKMVEKRGWTTKTIEAPYIKEKVDITAIDLLTRQIGQTIYMGGKTPAQRAEEELAKNLDYLRERIVRREEWMASSLLQSGKVVLDGEYEGMEVDFTMAADHLFVPALEWDDAGSDPISNLRTWCTKIAQDSGLNPTIVVMGSDAVNEFINNEKVQKLMNMLKLNMGEIKPADLPNGAAFYGTLSVGGATLDVYSYNEWYTDAAGDLQPILDPKKVVLGNPNARTSRGYGAILDIESAGDNQISRTYSTQYFAKSWIEPDPSARFLLVQSAPVVCLHQADAFGCATVLT